MSISEAAESLQQYLRRPEWLTGIGIGEHNGKPCIVVYVRRANPKEADFLKAGWQGFPVVIERMGRPRLLAAST